MKRRVKIAGSNKGMGDPFSPETPEQSKIREEMLTGIHGEFIKAVKTGRGGRLKFRQYPDVFSGRVYTGADALKVGLVDGLGNIYSVARDVVKAPMWWITLRRTISAESWADASAQNSKLACAKPCRPSGSVVYSISKGIPK